MRVNSDHIFRYSSREGIRLEDSPLLQNQYAYISGDSQDDLYLLVFCPFKIGFSEIQFNITSFNETQVTEIYQNTSIKSKETVNFYEEFSERLIPGLSTVQFVFDNLAEKSLISIDPLSFDHLSVLLAYNDTLGDAGSKEYSTSYNLSLYNLPKLNVVITNKSNITKGVLLYFKTYTPMAGTIRPGLLYLILTFITLVIVFIIAGLIILYSSNLNSARNEPKRSCKYFKKKYEKD